MNTAASLMKVYFIIGTFAKTYKYKYTQIFSNKKPYIAMVKHKIIYNYNYNY